jgi:hypothetical protein
MKPGNNRSKRRLSRSTLLVEIPATHYGGVIVAIYHADDAAEDRKLIHDLRLFLQLFADLNAWDICVYRIKNPSKLPWSVRLEIVGVEMRRTAFKVSQSHRLVARCPVRAGRGVLSPQPEDVGEHNKTAECADAKNAPTSQVRVVSFWGSVALREHGSPIGP